MIHWHKHIIGRPIWRCMLERYKLLNDYLLRLWPVNGEDQRLFFRRFKLELILFCLTSPFFLGIPFYLFNVMFYGELGMALMECLLGLILLVPWLIVPTIFVLVHWKSKQSMWCWIPYNLVFIAGWLVFLSFIIK